VSETAYPAEFGKEPVQGDLGGFCFFKRKGPAVGRRGRTSSKLWGDRGSCSLLWECLRLGHWPSALSHTSKQTRDFTPAPTRVVGLAFCLGCTPVSFSGPSLALHISSVLGKTCALVRRGALHPCFATGLRDAPGCSAVVGAISRPCFGVSPTPSLALRFCDGFARLLAIGLFACFQ
jgi:hypothetical protein